MDLFKLGTSYTLYLCGGATILTLWFIRSKSKSKSKSSNSDRNLPPGPFCFPFIGVLFMPLNKHRAVKKWSLKYKSDIVGFQVYPMDKWIVFLNSYQAIKEALLGSDTADALSGRPRNQVTDLTNSDLDGIVISDGPKWQEQRRFMLRTFKDLGFGRVSFEDTIRIELEDLLDNIKQQSAPPRSVLVSGNLKQWEREKTAVNRNNSCSSTGSREIIPIDPRIPLSTSVANVISALVFGKRLAGDPEFEEMANIINHKILTFSSSRLALLRYAMAKILMRLPGDIGGMREYLACEEIVKNFVSKQIEDHRSRMREAVAQQYQAGADVDGPTDDYIDAFLVEQRKLNSLKEVPKHYFTDPQLVRTVFDLFIAGMETTATTLRWAILILAHHQDIQDKIREEILSVMGTEQKPQLVDRAKMRYTDAALNEIQRFVTLVPFAVPHESLADCTVRFSGREYFLPKGAMISPNIFAVHHDPEIWSDPEHFNPEANFIQRDEDGKISGLKNMEYMIQFGVGKRSCIGESLARQELWIFFVGILQHFKIVAHPKFPLPSEYQSTDGITRMVGDYKVCFIPTEAEHQ